MQSMQIWEVFSFQKKTLQHSHCLAIQAGSPEQGWPKNSIRGWQAADFPVPYSCPAAAKNWGLFLCGFFFLLIQPQQGCWAWLQSCGAWASTAGSWDGAGEQKMLSQGFSTSLPCAAGTQPLQGQGNSSAAVMKHIWGWVCSTGKLWQPWPALEASRPSAKLVNQGMLNCQVHQTSKETKLFPWNSFCSLATETFPQSFPLKSQAVRCSGIPGSCSPQPSSSSAVQNKMSQNNCEKSCANTKGINKMRGKNG